MTSAFKGSMWSKPQSLFDVVIVAGWWRLASLLSCWPSPIWQAPRRHHLWWGVLLACVPTLTIASRHLWALLPTTACLEPKALDTILCQLLPNLGRIPSIGGYANVKLQ